MNAAVSYHLDRDVLIERSGAKGGALAISQALPERMGYIEPHPFIEMEEVVAAPTVIDVVDMPAPALKLWEGPYPKLPACLPARP
jgi:hypothetical protein